MQLAYLLAYLLAYAPSAFHTTLFTLLNNTKVRKRKKKKKVSM